MDIRELKILRERPQAVTNILDVDFDFKWDWFDYSIKKGDTETYQYYLAEHCALHMARKYATDKWDIKHFARDAWKIVDKIMGKDYIDYDALTLKEAKEIAKKRKLKLEIDWKDKNKAAIIADLKKTH